MFLFWGRLHRVQESGILEVSKFQLEDRNHNFVLLTLL